MAAEEWKSYTVKTKSTWGDTWTLQPHLICTQLRMAVMPTIDSASLLWRIGTMLQGATDYYARYGPIDLVGKYVRIEIPSIGVDWVGYVANEGDSRSADQDNAGNRVIAVEDQQFTAVGLEWFLTRTQIDSTVYYVDESDVVRVQRPVGFNAGSGSGRDILSAERGNKDSRDGVFTSLFAKDPDNSEEWTADEIVEHILFYHGPEDESGFSAPVLFEIDANAAQYLEWYNPTVATEDRTVFQVLNEIIDRRRGLVWWLEYTDGEDIAYIHITSSLASSIALPGGGTIPAALTDTTYNFDQDIAVARASVRSDGSQKYDRVKVRGARRRSVMTVSVADGNLEESWSSSEESAYKTAEGSDPDKNDRFRQANRFDRVYQAFTIPSEWNGRAGDGQGGTQYYVSPELAPGGISTAETQTYNVHGLRVLRTTPLKAGFDYTDATNPTSNLPANTKPEYLQPFGLAKHDDKFVFIDRSANHIDEDASEGSRLKYSYALRTLAGEPGFEVKPGGGLPHALAKNHFDSGSPGESNVEPEIDFEEMIFTVCVEWDSYCEGVWPVAVPTASPVQTLVIYAGDRYRLDWLAENTVFDIDDQGGTRTVTTGGPLQDDRRILEDLAQLALQWYSVPRASLDLSFRNVQKPANIGTLITDIGTSLEETAKTVNATVSQLTFNPEEGTSAFTAGYAELDFGGLV